MTCNNNLTPFLVSLLGPSGTMPKGNNFPLGSNNARRNNGKIYLTVKNSYISYSERRKMNVGFL